MCRFYRRLERRPTSFRCGSCQSQIKIKMTKKEFVEAVASGLRKMNYTPDYLLIIADIETNSKINMRLGLCNYPINIYYCKKCFNARL